MADQSIFRKARQATGAFCMETGETLRGKSLTKKGPQEKDIYAVEISNE